MSPDTPSLGQFRPDAWGMLVGQAGAFLVYAGLILGLASGVLGFMASRRENLARPARLCFIGSAVSLIAVFFLLGALFLGEQYQFKYVFGHNQADYELQYKISGIWAGQEGSILLWSLMTSVFGLLSLRAFGGYKSYYLAVYGLLLAMMAAISAFESPFKHVISPALNEVVRPPDGQGMSPTLLNYWIVIHPPTIFAGFGSLAVLFALSIAAMLKRDLESWVTMARPWALASLSLLGLGLCMGGFWAYETLGWGGFWAWDPVENASFVPWCALAAFIHGAFVQVARKKWQLANLALAASPFMLFCYGTFMTRSGFLGDTSVHSFAKMDPNALGVLIFLMGSTLVGFAGTMIPTAIWFRRQKSPDGKPDEKGWLHKTGFYGSAMWLLFAFGLVTAIGMSVPLIQSLTGQEPKVVEESLYHQVLAWFFPPVMLAMAIAPMLTWRHMPLKQLLPKILNPLAVSIGLTGLLLLWVKWGWQGEVFDPSITSKMVFGLFEVQRMPWVMVLTWLCLFAICLNAAKLLELLPRSRQTVGGIVTHLGVVLTMLGLIFSRGLEQKELLTLHPTREAKAFGYQISLLGPTHNLMSRHNEMKLQVTGERSKFVAHPGLYFRVGPEGEPQETIWPHVERRPLYDLYFTLHAMVWEATDPVVLEKGQQARYQNMLITYEGLKTEGTPGTSSAKFTADTTVITLGRKETITPSIGLGPNPAPSAPVPLAGGERLVLVAVDIDAGTALLRVIKDGVPKSITLKQGASGEAHNLRITYRRPGTSIERLITEIDVEPILSVSKAAPFIQVQSDPAPVRVSDEYNLLLTGIDAGTKNATYQFNYVQPAYPLEVFYKPLTWLVWFGVGIMTLGGFMAAYSRRTARRNQPPRSSVEREEPEKPEPKESDAPVPAAQV